MAKKGLNLTKHTQIIQLEGKVIARFALFGIEGTGATEDEAMNAMAKEKFGAFVEEHGEEIDPTAGLSPDAKQAMKAVRGVTSAELEDLIRGNTPVLVDFWAEWCKPCFMVAPAIRDLKNELQGRAEVVKLNIDEEKETADRFDVKSIPTLILFRDGREQLRLVGARPKAELEREIGAVL